MKKWTLQLTLLIGVAISIFTVTRFMANPTQDEADQIGNKSAIEKIQSAVNLRGIGRHLLDFQK